MRYKQAIQIGDNVTDIMRLPCVMGCHKDDKDALVYILFDWDECGNYKEVRMEDWLCETYDGRWVVKKSVE